jgi:CRP-like cAMP-binding protein
MDDSVLKKSALFRALRADVWQTALEQTPHRIQHYNKGEIIFHLMEPADKIGIVLSGKVEVQKSFRNGSQVNVSTRSPGELIGAAAVFSRHRRYPCDIVSLEPSAILVFHREQLLKLLQTDVRILENFTTEIASATYMLQQRLELLSYHGIGQKAAFWLLTQLRQTGKTCVQIPGSVSKWAMLMNVSRPSLHRELKKLEGDGIITYAPPAIEILNAEALQDVLSI